MRLPTPSPSSLAGTTAGDAGGLGAWTRFPSLHSEVPNGNHGCYLLLPKRRQQYVRLSYAQSCDVFPRGLATSPTVVRSHPTQHNTHSGLFFHVDPRQVTHICPPTHSSHPSPPPPPARPPPSPVSSDSAPISPPAHPSSSRPKRQAAPSTFHARPLRAFSTLPFPVKLASTHKGDPSSNGTLGVWSVSQTQISPHLTFSRPRLLNPDQHRADSRPASPRSRVPVPAIEGSRSYNTPTAPSRTTQEPSYPSRSLTPLHPSPSSAVWFGWGSHLGHVA